MGEAGALCPQDAFLRGAVFFEGGFGLAGGAAAVVFGDDAHFERRVHAGVFRAFAGKVGGKAGARVGGDAAVECAVAAVEEVDVPVGWMVFFYHL